MEWASNRKSLTLHFMPAYASWLNQIEIPYGIFARDVICQSKHGLMNQTMQYIKRCDKTNAPPLN
jgi:hypothetical protein